MAARRSGAWSTLINGSAPSGNAVIGSGVDRNLVFCVTNENVGRQTISTFTVGGVSSDYNRQFHLPAGSTDNNIWMYVWDEASIQSMVGTAIVFGGISNQANIAWAYATLQDSAQVTPFFDDGGDTPTASVPLNTPSSPDDFLVGLSMDRSQNRRPLSCDTMTQQREYSVSEYAMAIFDDPGGPDISTFTNDGIPGDFCAMSAVFSEVTAGKFANAQFSSIDGVNRANIDDIQWGWYDQLPGPGVFPTEFGGPESTDAQGNFSVEIEKSTLEVGQVGYLGVLSPSRDWTGFYAITVSAT